jgi:cytochrome c
LQAKGGDWTYEDINRLIFKPTAYVKGTKMAFAVWLRSRRGPT